MDTLWWKQGVIYQIYPRSFQDTNGDGVGDLKGITHRLDYCVDLRIDAIWISPIYPSPMADFGYDVANYCDIDPLFGTLADFDALITAAHARGLKLILDFVPNHTSDQHPWFLESKSSKNSPKRDWYIWKDAKSDGSPPNNWISNFGGSAWQFDASTGQYFYHAFLKQQPDLNWRNPEVRKAMFDVLRFWLDRGVDGFRVDVIWHLMKDPEFRDNPPNPSYQPHDGEINKLLQTHSADHPDIYGVIAEMRKVLEEYDDRVLIGEIYLPIERLVTYYGSDLSGAHLPFNFQLIRTAWSAVAISALINEYEAAIPEGGWPNWVLGNHDQKRITSRIGADQARVAAMLLLTLRGTPTLYYGDELGMADGLIPTNRVQDPWERNEPGLGLGRDPQRTPMQWGGGTNAGFSSGEPWLPMAASAQTCNVETLEREGNSILSLYRKLLALRRSNAALSVGNLRLLATTNSVLVYERFCDGERYLVALNFSGDPQDVSVDGVNRAELVLSTTGRSGDHRSATLALAAHEGVILRA